ncbi:hypothetical protein CEXT_540311 [Caerostris extrusa]|uniref:Uncharacterized protein n=1 Tax=Caerostris extrusa TaxID=172846 RepID=A0AAV4M5L8_CAEEX|nr:hypothetical protein CEXT_540311 [Caerostris extrusa]
MWVTKCVMSLAEKKNWHHLSSSGLRRVTSSCEEFTLDYTKPDSIPNVTLISDTLSQSTSINPPRTIIRNSFPPNRRPYPVEGLPKAF